MSNIKIIFHDVLTSFPNKFSNDFDMLIDEMVYPVFIRRFSKKLELIESRNPKLAQKVMSIKTEADCIV